MPSSTPDEDEDDDDEGNWVDYQHQGIPDAIKEMTVREIDELMKERKTRFGKFNLENADKLQDYEDHPINYDAVSSWRERLRIGEERVRLDGERLRGYRIEIGYDGGLQNAEGYRKKMQTWDQIEMIGSFQAKRLASIFATCMHYVSKDSFLAELDRLAQMVEGYRQGEIGVYAVPRKIVWFVHHASGRSDTWVTLLMWTRVYQHVDALVSSYAEIHELAQKEGWDDMMVVVTDDAAFTGAQIQNRVSEYSLEFEDDLGQDYVQFFFAVPFMSQQAIDYILQTNMPFSRARSWYKVPDYTGHDAMKTMVECIKESQQPEDLALFDEIRENTLITEVKRSHIPVYFAHKLADLVSVPNFLFALAPYLDIDDRREVITIRRMTLIDNCHPENYTYDLDAKADDPDNDFLQNEGRVCPMPPYKIHQYTWGGVPVPKDENIVAFLDEYEP